MPFCPNKTKNLGHIVSSSGIETDPEILQAIQKCPQPLNLKDVQRFLGLSGYYRRLFKDFSRLGRPLTQLTKKKVKESAPYQFNETELHSIKIFKDALTNPPVLGHPDYSLPFEIHPDACSIGIDALPIQKQPDR